MKKLIEKKATEKKRTKKYEPPLQINGSFMDIMKTAVKDANDNSAKKQLQKK